MPIALIAGAGIGGLAAGIALRAAGWQCRIFERAAAPRPVGFGLALAPNALAALRELGVGDAVAAVSVMPTTGEIRGPGGRSIRRVVMDPAELPGGDLSRIVVRQALHRVLIDAAGETNVETDRTAAGFDVGSEGVRLRFADGTFAEGDILVGADGIGSVIRAHLHPGEAPAHPSGYVAVRGLSRAVRELRGVQALWYFAPGVESGVVQAAPDAIYWFVSLPSARVGPGPHDPAAIVRRWTSGFGEQYRAITAGTLPDDLRYDELMARPPLAHWGRGPVTLLGDAAHPMLPHTGQGAAQALEDAVALGRALRDASDPAAALRRYESVRRPRTNRIVNRGPQLARLTTTSNPVVRLLRTAAIRVLPRRAILAASARAGRDPHRELGPPLRPPAPAAAGPGRHPDGR